MTSPRTIPAALPVKVGLRELPGTLTVPAVARGVVVFAHGGGVSRLVSVNGFVAQALQDAGFATLASALLDEKESDDRRTAFDLELLAARLAEATEWVRRREETRGLPLGYYGVSTGAAAALAAAAEHPQDVSAVVSRGGRPDLVKAHLPRVQAPTLLIVAGEDEPVVAMNQLALDLLGCEKRLEIIPHARRPTPEPAELERRVASLAVDWLQRHLAPVPASPTL